MCLSGSGLPHSKWSFLVPSICPCRRGVRRLWLECKVNKWMKNFKCTVYKFNIQAILSKTYLSCIIPSKLISILFIFSHCHCYFCFACNSRWMICRKWLAGSSTVSGVFRIKVDNLSSHMLNYSDCRASRKERDQGHGELSSARQWSQMKSTCSHSSGNPTTCSSLSCEFFSQPPHRVTAPVISTVWV